MSNFKSDFLRVMRERGHVNQCTDFEALDRKASSEVISGYIGFDATADSLHVGNLAGIMMLRRLQQTGHRPIVLMGGGTTKIGDPSGKDELRRVLSDETIASNIAGIKKAFAHFLTFGEGKTDAVMVNNADWLDNLGYIPFLREVGRHFTINRMLTFDSVKLRLEREQPLTFLEFNYMIMQGYDFVEMYKRLGVTLQMGGSDQWGNIVNGVELGRRMKDIELFGLTTPLITKASGEKMGKSVSGAVWINKDRLSPYDYWQFWRNTEDADVVRFLKLFTDLPLSEIDKLGKLRDAEINEAKKILAFEATKLAHGEEEALAATKTASEAFEGSGKAADLPTYTFSRDAKPLIVDVVVSLGLASSKGEAKRLIEQGGIRLNDAPVTSLAATIETSQLDATGIARISVGKKKRALAKAV
ncbi:MAG: tyrosine--tRNA ligase [Alphaproteobacteria bacterium]|nr:tyrosine--tRNA ligase [Alphaproteobacteria bacterium]